MPALCAAEVGDGLVVDCQRSLAQWLLIQLNRRVTRNYFILLIIRWKHKWTLQWLFPFRPEGLLQCCLVSNNNNKQHHRKVVTDICTEGLMDHFDDVTQNCDFLCFSLKQKFISMNRFIVPSKHLPPGIHFFVNIGKFGLSYFQEFATDFPETSQVN